MRKQRLLLGIFFLFAAGAVGGCAARVKNVTNLPPGVTLKQVQDWDAAVGNLHKIATVTSTLRQTVIGLNRAGVYGDSKAYIASLRAIAKVDQLQIDAANFLQPMPATFGEAQKAKLRDFMGQIAAEINTLNTQGILGIKNPDSQRQVTQLIAEITAAVNLVLAFAS